MKTTTKTLFTMLFVTMVLFYTIQSAYAMPWDTPTILLWYMHPEAHTVNTILGYALNTTVPETATSTSVTEAGDEDVWVAARVFKANSVGTLSEMTDGDYAVNVTRTVNGVGIQTVTWTPENTVIMVGSDAVRVNVYLKVGANDYEHKVTLMSDILETDQINNATWTFHLYTNRTYSASTTVTFDWGDSTHLSRISNVQVETLDPWETQLYHLRNFDFLGFLFTPWTYHIGDLFWGFGLLFVSITTYNKYHSLRSITAMCWLFLGAGGIFNLLIPPMALTIVWLFLGLALALTFYHLVKR